MAERARRALTPREFGGAAEYVRRPYAQRGVEIAPTTFRDTPVRAVLVHHVQPAYFHDAGTAGRPTLRLALGPDGRWHVSEVIAGCLACLESTAGEAGQRPRLSSCAEATASLRSVQAAVYSHVWRAGVPLPPHFLKVSHGLSASPYFHPRAVA